MIIALFTDTFLPNKNGVATSVAQLHQHLQQLGHTVYVYTIKIPGCDKQESNTIVRSFSFDAHIGINEGRIALANVPQIRHKLKADGVQLIHTHTEFSIGLVGRFVARSLNIPHIHTLHTMWNDYTHYFFNGIFLNQRQVNQILKTFISRCTAVVAPSPKASAYLTSIGVGNVIVNNGVDSALFTRSTLDSDKKELRQALQIEESDVVVLFVGRMAQEKRVIPLYETLKKAMHHSNNLKAIFIGEGADKEVLQEQAITDHLEARFKFTGFIPYEQIANYYAISQFYCTVSVSEVQPMTVIEALISGLPIVARQDLAYEGLAVAGVNGYQLDTDDEVAKAVATLASNSSLREAYSKESKVIATHFSADRQAAEMAALYQRVIAYGRPKGRQQYPIRNEGSMGGVTSR